MTDNWNRAVGKDDIVFHLGDFCLGGSAIWAQVRERLNGHIYLCMGNHDLKNMRPGFARLFEEVTMQYHLMSGSSSGMCIAARTIQAKTDLAWI